jgi:hypothetical protein
MGTRIRAAEPCQTTRFPSSANVPGFVGGDCINVNPYDTRTLTQGWREPYSLLNTNFSPSNNVTNNAADVDVDVNDLGWGFGECHMELRDLPTVILDAFVTEYQK